MTSVYVTIPNGNGWIHKRAHFAICGLLMDGRYKVRHDAPTHSPYVENLHRCVKDFLKGGEDFWLTMDDDNPPQRNPLDLVELDCDVLGFPTPVWANMKEGDRPYYLNAVDRVGEGYKPHEPPTGLQEVDAVGSGCMLIARRVLVELSRKQPFARQWNPEDGTVELGGDFSFCQKAKVAGFRIWAHFDYLCDHFNELSLLEMIHAMNTVKRDEA